MVYIGETSRRLGNRFREDTLIHNKTELPVSQHFCGADHLKEDIRVFHTGFRDEQTSKREEMRLIFNLKTLAPYGMNLLHACNGLARVRITLFIFSNHFSFTTLRKAGLLKNGYEIFNLQRFKV